MKIDKITYKNYGKAYKIESKEASITISTDIGPRILELKASKNGENILYNDLERSIYAKEYDWYIYGGHRFWISPETDLTYDPDNKPCKIEETNDSVSFINFSEKTKIEKTINIKEKDGRFIVKHILKNKSDFLFQGGIWALTCIIPEGEVFFPWGGATKGWDTKKIIYWNKWGGTHSTKLNSTQYKPTEDLFIINPTGEEGKVGTAGWEGFVGVSNRNKNYTFVKKFNRKMTSNYPDDNCAIEIYTCKHFIELETLDEIVMLSPGQSVEFIEEWIVLPSYISPEKGDEIRKVL